MTTHIGARPGEIAETVLLPGDPLRARWAAENFLKNARLVNEVRGMLGYTGSWNGHSVSIHGGGMGMASLSIYVNELIRDYGVRSIIRIGSAGGMVPQVAMRDLVIAASACAISTPSQAVLRELHYAPTADWVLLRSAVAAAERRGSKFHVGQIYSSDTFYSERPDLDAEMVRHGVLAVEMETAELYTLAARHGVRALTVLTISDHLVTREALPPLERERSFGEMVEIALEAAFA